MVCGCKQPCGSRWLFLQYHLWTICGSYLHSRNGKFLTPFPDIRKQNPPRWVQESTLLTRLPCWVYILSFGNFTYDWELLAYQEIGVWIVNCYWHMDVDSVYEFYTLKIELLTVALLQRPPHSLSRLVLGQGNFSVMTDLYSPRRLVVYGSL